jgi:hypothetical protein
VSDKNVLLNALTREGVLISVSVRYWRATKKLKAEDLGLNPNNVTDRLISLGHKRLVPKEALEKFAQIEGKVHSMVESSTFTFLNVARFLPNSQLDRVTGELKTLEQEFIQVRDEFLENYAELRKQAQREWRKAAKHLVSDPERLLATIEDSFPLPERMGRYFSFETQLFQVSAPDRLSLEAVSIGDQQEIIKARQRAAAEASQKINTGVETFVADCVAALREQTATLCEEMLQSMNTGKTGCHQKTLNRLVNFIDQFKSLNFVNDAEMEQQLEHVRQEFLTRSAEEYRDNPDAERDLREGLKGLAGYARNLSHEEARELVSQFGQMGRRRISLAA